MVTENVIEKFSGGTDGNIKITIYKKMPTNQKKVYDLIMDCVKNKRVLDDDLLQEWFMEKIVKPRNRMIDGKYIGTNSIGWNVYERISEYETRKKEISEHGRLRYWHFSEAKQLLKYAIGALVMRGHLTVLPSIKINDEQPNQLINHE